MTCEPLEGQNTRCTQLPERLQALVQRIEQHDHLNPSLCKKLLTEAQITPDDLMAWADFDHPKEDSYGRKLVHNGGFFELMVMSWVDGDMAAIHDHGYTQWGAVQLFGHVEHAIFKVENGTLITAERKMFEPGSVVSVGHEMIHQMGNVGQAPYLTLHLYGCYERDCDVTADARLYALDEGKIQITSGGVFFNLPESCVDRRQEAPRADFPTLLRDRVELLKRLLRTHGSFETGTFGNARAESLAAELFAAGTWQRCADELRKKLATANSLANARYLGILHQELRATAQLERQLIAANLVAHAPEGWTAKLDELLALDDMEEFGTRYLDLVSEAWDIDIPHLSLDLAAGG